MMTPEDRAALREAAAKATPGPWEMERGYKSPDVVNAAGLVVAVTIASDMKPPTDEANARYIALAHPASVLSLLDAADERDRLRALLRAVLSSLETHLPYAPWHGEKALDEDGALLVHPESLIGRARAALEAAP